MSRIGKKGIIVPTGVSVEIAGDSVKISGPLGLLEKKNDSGKMKITFNDGVIYVVPVGESKNTAAWGTCAAHIKNMVSGVTRGFEKKLIVQGVGFKVQQEGKNLVFSLGLSHPIKVEVPADLKATVEKNTVAIFGSNKESVGQFSASLRALKKPEPYKGKGIKYENETIRRKSGKKAAAVGQ